MSINTSPQVLMLDLGGVLLKEPESNLSTVLPAQLIAEQKAPIRIFNRAFDFIFHVCGIDHKKAWIMGSQSGEYLVGLVHAAIDNPLHYDFFNNEQERMLIKHGIEYILVPHHIAALTTLFDESMPFIQRCKQSTIRLMIISNWDPESFKALQQKFPYFFSYFDESDLIIPATIGYIKPEAEIYSAAQSKLDRKAQIFFVDDSERNVHGAHRAGISGITHKNWLTTQQELKAMGLRLDS